MHIKSITALAFATALTVFGAAPASANTASEGTVARDELTTSNYRCGCYRGYVRYYRVYPVVRVYRVRYVRYYYI